MVRRALEAPLFLPRYAAGTVFLWTQLVRLGVRAERASRQVPCGLWGGHFAVGVVLTMVCPLASESCGEQKRVREAQRVHTRGLAPCGQGRSPEEQPAGRPRAKRRASRARGGWGDTQY